PSGGIAPEWTILRSLTESLLTREHTRLLEGWLDDLRRPMFPDDASIDGLYSPVEQCQRLLALVEDQQRLELPVDLHVELRESYDTAVETQLRNHPFLASLGTFVSPIFRDYCYASVISSPEALARVQ